MWETIPNSIFPQLSKLSTDSLNLESVNFNQTSVDRQMNEQAVITTKVNESRIHKQEEKKNKRV